jgi:hypothetical protein
MTNLACAAVSRSRTMASWVTTVLVASEFAGCCQNAPKLWSERI